MQQVAASLCNRIHIRYAIPSGSVPTCDAGHRIFVCQQQQPLGIVQRDFPGDTLHESAPGLPAKQLRLYHQQEWSQTAASETAWYLPGRSSARLLPGPGVLCDCRDAVHLARTDNQAIHRWQRAAGPQQCQRSRQLWT